LLEELVGQRRKVQVGQRGSTEIPTSWQNCRCNQVPSAARLGGSVEFMAKALQRLSSVIPALSSSLQAAPMAAYFSTLCECGR
jgi:hypothetical protein